jgi:hypothetical protein
MDEEGLIKEVGWQRKPNHCWRTLHTSTGSVCKLVSVWTIRAWATLGYAATSRKAGLHADLSHVQAAWCTSQLAAPQQRCAAWWTDPAGWRGVATTACLILHCGPSLGPLASNFIPSFPAFPSAVHHADGFYGPPALGRNRIHDMMVH